MPYWTGKLKSVLLTRVIHLVNFKFLLQCRSTHSSQPDTEMCIQIHGRALHWSTSTRPRIITPPNRDGTLRGQGSREFAQRWCLATRPSGPTLDASSTARSRRYYHVQQIACAGLLGLQTFPTRENDQSLHRIGSTTPAYTISLVPIFLSRRLNAAPASSHSSRSQWRNTQLGHVCFAHQVQFILTPWTARRTSDRAAQLVLHRPNWPTTQVEDRSEPGTQVRGRADALVRCAECACRESRNGKIVHQGRASGRRSGTFTQPAACVPSSRHAQREMVVPFPR